MPSGAVVTVSLYSRSFGGQRVYLLFSNLPVSLSIRSRRQTSVGPLLASLSDSGSETALSLSGLPASPVPYLSLNGPSGFSGLERGLFSFSLSPTLHIWSLHLSARLESIHSKD